MRMRERIWRAVTGVVGPNEFLLALALALVAFALWPSVGRLALLPAAAVMLFVGLPTRRRFVESVHVEDRSKQT
jgi:hypothetical protein